MSREEPGATLVRMVYFCDRKRYGSRQETATAELRSRGTMHSKELVSKTGTRLRWPISVADRGQNSTCILLYRTVARNGGGIQLSVVCLFSSWPRVIVLNAAIATIARVWSM